MIYHPSNGHHQLAATAPDANARYTTMYNGRVMDTIPGQITIETSFGDSN
jgi:hypothetical protein